MKTTNDILREIVIKVGNLEKDPDENILLGKLGSEEIEGYNKAIDDALSIITHYIEEDEG